MDGMKFCPAVAKSAFADAIVRICRNLDFIGGPFSD